MTPRFGRVLTAMVTPFKRDLSIDYDLAGELAVAIIESGSDGVVVAGTTGESATITMAEQSRLFREVRDAVGKSGFVIGGTGGNSTEECLELGGYAEQAGLDGVLVVAPYYNKPSQEGLYQHFKHIAGRTGLPIILYNIPGRCAVNIEAATTARLAEIDNIVAIKEAAGSMDQATDIISRTGPGFDVYSGDDSVTLPMMSVGAVGVVSVAAHLAGRQIQQMIADFADGKVGEAAAANARLFPFCKSLFITVNPVPVKAALCICGWDCGSVRLPLVEATEGEKQTLRAAIAALPGGVSLKSRGSAGRVAS